MYKTIFSLVLFSIVCFNATAFATEELLQAIRDQRIEHARTLLHQSQTPLLDLGYAAEGGYSIGILIERAGLWQQVLKFSDLSFSELKAIIKNRAYKWNDRMRPRDLMAATEKMNEFNQSLMAHFAKANEELVQAERAALAQQAQDQIAAFRLLLEERRAWLKDFETVPAFVILMDRGEGITLPIIQKVNRACKDGLMVGSETEKRAIRAAVKQILKTITSTLPVPSFKDLRVPSAEELLDEDPAAIEPVAKKTRPENLGEREADQHNEQAFDPYHLEDIVAWNEDGDLGRTSSHGEDFFSTLRKVSSEVEGNWGFLDLESFDLFDGANL